MNTAIIISIRDFGIPVCLSSPNEPDFKAAMNRLKNGYATMLPLAINAASIPSNAIFEEKLSRNTP